MEAPKSLSANDIRDEKLKLLKNMETADIKSTVYGQYIASKDGKLAGYRDDPSIQSQNANSKQITFVQTVLFINNERWKNVPFICKCGKALDAKNGEIRIQFKNDSCKNLFPDSAFNELVILLQPNEAIWLKVNTKKPGFSGFQAAVPLELDLTYKKRFGDVKLPEAYTRLLLDSLRGDQSLFVREDELNEAWRIFTPLIHSIENMKNDPPFYERGSRGPIEADQIAQKYGFKRTNDYKYKC